MTGFLALEDGTVLRGESVGAEGHSFGEAVFTTAMTGYQEVVTDPSYSEQLVAFTAPMIGNYGVSPQRSESTRPHARAVLMRHATGCDWTRCCRNCSAGSMRCSSRRTGCAGCWTRSSLSAPISS